MTAVGFTAALNAPSNFASSSSHNVSATLSWIGSDLLSGANKTAAESTVESNSRQDVRVPATNSNGDYVTTIVGEYSEPFVYSSAFTSNGVVISGQATSFRVEWTYTEVEASHYGPVKTVESSTTAQIWDRSPFIVHGNDLPGYVPSSKNAAWFSFTSFGREPACTAAYSAFIATGPFNTKILTSVTSSTLPNGQTAVGIVYSTDIWAPDRADACCGYCTLIFQTLQMLYWPGPHPQTICPTTSGSMANHESAWSTRSPGEEGNGLNDQPVYATGSDGYILSVLDRYSPVIVVVY